MHIVIAIIKTKDIFTFYALGRTLYVKKMFGLIVQKKDKSDSMENSMGVLMSYSVLS